MQRPPKKGDPGAMGAETCMMVRLDGPNTRIDTLDGGLPQDRNVASDERIASGAGAWVPIAVPVWSVVADLALGRAVA